MHARRSLLNIVLAICLLLSQQAGLAHAITHLGTFSGTPGVAKTVELSADTANAAIDTFCLECLAFAQIAAAATGNHAFAALAAATLSPQSSPQTGRHCFSLLAFRARAPPVLL
jgi:hypothetical protein